MQGRSYSPLDRLLGEFDKIIKILYAPARPGRPSPAGPGGELGLNEAERLESTRLMRVNHSGEIAAQALYQGQGLTARDPAVAAVMRRAADEEIDHLAWCEERIRELGGRTSLLNPLWYLGSFAIGAVAGALGDRASLGFIAETERQVEAHLHGHMDRLPAADHDSRAIVDQMSRDEAAHGAQATSLGGHALPSPLRSAMKLTARMMTGGSYWL
jgi:ubiquinone biosynthesis monooxygenase Coq7